MQGPSQHRFSVVTSGSPARGGVPAAEATLCSRAAELVLWSARRYAYPEARLYLAPRRTTPVEDIITAHRCCGVSLSGNGLIALLAILTRRAAPAWEFSCPHCTVRTAHETGLLTVLAHLQSGEVARAARSLREVGCDPVAPLVLPLARHYAADLALGGLLVAAEEGASVGHVRVHSAAHPQVDPVAHPVVRA